MRKKEPTVRQKILLAAEDIGPVGTFFNTEYLIVRCWRMFPEAFGLRNGYEQQYPDSNRVIAKLAGSDGLCGRGWLARKSVGMYSLTEAGKIEANKNKTKEKTDSPVPKPSKVRGHYVFGSPLATLVPAHPDPAVPEVVLTSEEAAEVTRLSKHPLMRRYLRGYSPSLQDAMDFWGIELQPNREEILSKVSSLLDRAIRAFQHAPITGPPGLPRFHDCHSLYNVNLILQSKYGKVLVPSKD